MTRPRLLDLFAGAGGAAVGYDRAGFDVVGVDIVAQPRYPFEFVQAEALMWMEALILAHGFSGCSWPVDAIHASPPCQRYSDLAKRNGNADEHPDLIGPVRGLLIASGLPYVIENVEGAPLHDPVLICGTNPALDMPRGTYRVRRHRLFESNIESFWGVPCCCSTNPHPLLDVTGGGPTRKPRTDGKGGRTYKGTADEARETMGIDWMTKAELNEAIPPAYTEYIGRQVLTHLAEKAAV